MNVNALLVDTLDSLLPTADSVYKGAATEYIVFNYTELPAEALFMAPGEVFDLWELYLSAHGKNRGEEGV